MGKRTRVRRAATPSGEPTHLPISPSMSNAQLAGQVASLRRDLTALRDEITTEVRTQRLVVGDERSGIIAEASERTATIEAFITDDHSGRRCTASMTASQDGSTRPGGTVLASASLAVAPAGNITAGLRGDVCVDDCGRQTEDGNLQIHREVYDPTVAFPTAPYLLADARGLALMQGSAVVAEASMQHAR